MNGGYAFAFLPNSLGLTVSDPDSKGFFETVANLHRFRPRNVMSNISDTEEMVRPHGLEPWTSSLKVRRSTN